MQLPSFSYSISRPYPYTWFTWVVIVGGICATVFFSILNLAANGYVLEVQYTTNYQETLAQKRWTRRFPFSLFDKTVINCQPQDLPVNSQFFTENLALLYTLTSVWRQQGNFNLTLPSLKYTRNKLENCAVAYLQIDLESSGRTAAQQGWQEWGPKAFVSTQSRSSFYDILSNFGILGSGNMLNQR